MPSFPPSLFPSFWLLGDFPAFSLSFPGIWRQRGPNSFDLFNPGTPGSAAPLKSIGGGIKHGIFSSQAGLLKFSRGPGKFCGFEKIPGIFGSVIYGFPTPRPRNIRINLHIPKGFLQEISSRSRFPARKPHFGKLGMAISRRCRKRPAIPAAPNVELPSQDP